MASYTKDELRSLLTNHGVELPASTAKKEELVTLYEEFVEPFERSKGEFSSDDEEIVITTKKTSKKSSQKSSSDKSHIIFEEIVSEAGMETYSLEDIQKFSDEELIEHLKAFGVEPGPIVMSTRSLYEKKLVNLLKGPTGDISLAHSNGSGELNDSLSATETANGENGHNLLKNGEFSADEENTEDDEIRPSVVVRKAETPVKRTSGRTPNKSKATPKSKFEELGTSLRQRFTPDTPDGRTDRFTPTPRRSIHSYKVTETTTETVVKTPDGNISRDFSYVKETSNSQEETGGRGWVLRFLPKLFLVLILATVGYYLYINYSQEMFNSASEDNETPAPAVVTPAPRDPAPDQASITDV